MIGDVGGWSVEIVFRVVIWLSDDILSFEYIIYILSLYVLFNNVFPSIYSLVLHYLSIFQMVFADFQVTSRLYHLQPLLMNLSLFNYSLHQLLFGDEKQETISETFQLVMFRCILRLVAYYMFWFDYYFGLVLI